MSGGFEQAYQDQAEADNLDRAALALYRAAGRPEAAWDDLTHHEKEAWRHCALTNVNAYHQEDA